MKKKDRNEFDATIWNSGYYAGRIATLFPLYACDIIDEDYLIRQLTADKKSILLEFQQFCIAFATDGRIINPSGYRAKDAYLAHIDLGRALTEEETEAFRLTDDDPSLS